MVVRIVKAMVDHLDSVQVSELRGERAHVIELVGAPSDFGKMLPRKGANASAIRTLLNAIGGKENWRYILEIIDDSR